MEISVGVSLGEVADRLSVLQVKSKYITDEKKRQIVDRERNRLHNQIREELDQDLPAEYSNLVPEFWQAVGRLFGVNAALWEVLAEQRAAEGDEFCRYAREVIRLNDERYKIKRALDDAFGAEFPEQKEYLK